MTEIKNIAAVEWQIPGSEAKAVIYKAGKEPDYSSCEEKEIPGYVFYCKDETETIPCFEYNENEDLNIFPLRLKETVSYCCKIKGNCTDIEISIANEDNKFVKIEHEKDRIRFQFINYLGKSRIIFKFGKNSQKLDFEIVPDKINYEEDYIVLTEAIAEECSALLLDYESPTSLTFKQYEDKQNTVLEQFIFLRSFCSADNISGLFASIKRNPDRILSQEDEIRPFGMGFVSKKFFSNPFSYSRGWAKVKGANIPSMVACSRKYDSYDTPANRFIKFALSQFHEICSKIQSIITGNTNIEYKNEAKAIQRHIEGILSDHFFDDVQELDAMPSNSQILEKREGYSQIFKAFSMLDLALQLNWRGKDDIYLGEAKNTALLYEYWLFFELRKILIELNGHEENAKEENAKQDKSFITSDDSLTISLKQGKESSQKFYFEKKKLRAILYYNRTFSQKDFKGSDYQGSYSRVFRPDYTISVFPNCFNNENEAVHAGEVSYIHFDAKYRISELAMLIGRKQETEKAENEQLQDEKKNEITNTYKRGDLLKMHTYNDAIRRTAGSYVLYPGDGNKDNRMSAYDEILPGVGAFAIKPGKAEYGERDLKAFISQILNFKAENTSRQYRRDYFENIILKSPKYGAEEKQDSDKSSGEKNIYMLGFMREEYIEYLRDSLPFDEDGKQKQPQTNQSIYFYYYAIKDGYVYPQHKDISKASDFISWHYRDGKPENGMEFYNFTAKTGNTRLVSRKEMCRLVYGDKAADYESKHNADYYYIAELAALQYAKEDFLKQFDIAAINEQESNKVLSPFSPKVCGVKAEKLLI